MLHEKVVRECYNPIFCWIKYRKGEPFPPELYHDFDDYSNISYRALYHWVFHRNEPIPEVLYAEFGKQYDSSKETVLCALIATGEFGGKRKLPTELMVAERNIKHTYYACVEPIYPFELWLKYHPYTIPPIELYPPELVPNHQGIRINWRENLRDFFLYLDPDNLELPDDLDPTCLIRSPISWGKETLMTLWIRYHQGRDIPDEFIFDIELYKANPSVVSPFITWLHVNGMGGIPELLYQYVGIERNTTFGYSELYTWIVFRTDEVPETFWKDLESYDHDGIDIVGEWEYSRPGQPLPDQLIPYIRESGDDY